MFLQDNKGIEKITNMLGGEIMKNKENNKGLREFE